MICDDKDYFKASPYVWWMLISLYQEGLVTTYWYLVTPNFSVNLLTYMYKDTRRLQRANATRNLNTAASTIQYQLIFFSSQSSFQRSWMLLPMLDSKSGWCCRPPPWGSDRWAVLVHPFLKNGLRSSGCAKHSCRVHPAAAEPVAATSPAPNTLANNVLGDGLIEAGATNFTVKGSGLEHW